MGSLFRSEDMSVCQLYLQAEAAYGCVAELGELGIVQFKDLNQDVNAFQRKFVHELRRCEEMERQLRYFEQELVREDMVPHDLNSIPEAPASRDMVDLEATYENLESELRELNNSLEALRRNHLELKELQYVLKHTEDFFLEAASGEIELNHFQDSPDIEHGAMDAQASRLYLGYVAGVLPRERVPGFMRLLWFACRGNIFVRHTEIEEPMIDSRTGEQIWKVVFIAFFQGEQLKAKVKKICEGYKASIYPCSESQEERREVALGVLTRLQDIDTVLQKSQEQKLRVLTTVAQNWNSWNVKVLKIKAIYHTMNMFHSEGKNYVAECYVPTRDLDTAQMVVNRATEQAGSSAPSIVHPIPTREVLPTYNCTNKFTVGYQNLIDAYGVANYKEVNAAPFAIITFPFLFSVMFGDFGHGVILTIFAAWMIIMEQKLYGPAKNSEMFSIIYAGRYIILMMGVFSMYSGLLYNDCFSKSFNLFGSSWSAKNYDNSTIISNKYIQMNPNTTDYHGYPYPFGIDPVWQWAQNKITFTNSFKKKISVIFGVAQMVLGVLLSIWNHVYFRHYLQIVCDFLPQLIFLLSIFGYLVSLLFVKWFVFGPQDPDCAPNLLIGFINMFLFNYKTENVVCSNWPWYTGQEIVQKCLVVIALVCALWMLLAKPIILYVRHKPQPTRGRSETMVEPLVTVDHETIQSGPDGEEDASETNVNVDDTVPIVSKDPPPEFNLGEEFIHQGIHTIEYCLGCVSHTASYLRLWALSLAHSQLSEVLWNMVMRIGFKYNGWIGVPLIVVAMVPFFFLTIIILVIMEGLSAFLHTLRLHWVEFQSKFYVGDGYPFTPFSFNVILEKGLE